MQHQQIDALSTRTVQLRLWANLVRSCPHTLRLMHGIEYVRADDLKMIAIYASDETAFALAIKSNLFGLKNPSTLADIMKHFKLTQAQLHSFSCDCGGAISKDDMAQRIERLA